MKEFYSVRKEEKQNKKKDNRELERKIRRKQRKSIIDIEPELLGKISNTCYVPQITPFHPLQQIIVLATKCNHMFVCTTV